jgi:hypothetical protein
MVNQIFDRVFSSAVVSQVIASFEGNLIFNRIFIIFFHKINLVLHLLKEAKIVQNI